MPGSVTWVFGEPKDFQAVLREDGVLSLLVTARGAFRARLTQVTLHNLRLSTGDEHLPRIAFVAARAGGRDAGSAPSRVSGTLRARKSGCRTICDLKSLNMVNVSKACPPTWLHEKLRRFVAAYSRTLAKFDQICIVGESLGPPPKLGRLPFAVNCAGLAAREKPLRGNGRSRETSSGKRPLIK